MDSIIENFIHEFDFKSLIAEEIISKIREPTFKVLKISNCPTLKDLLNLIRNESDSIIKQSSHLFFISAELQDNVINITEDELRLLQLLLGEDRPLIVQLISGLKHCVIYYKDENEKSLQMLKDVHQLSQNEMFEKINDPKTSKFALLIRALSSNWLGRFNGNLLESMLNNTDERMINTVTKALAKSSSLCIRFLNLFKLNISIAPAIVTSSLKSTGIGRFLAYFDLPQNGNEQDIGPGQIENIKKFRNSLGRNLLEMSVEANNTEAVKYFSTFFAFEFDLKNASSLAIDLKHYESFSILISAGSKFPSNFVIDELITNETFSRIIDERKSFHEDIKLGSVEKVQSFLKRNQNLKTAFYVDNKSALTTALESSQFKVFALLRSQGYSEEGDEHYEKIWNKLTKQQQAEITEANREYFKYSDEPHIMKIISKSRLSFDSIDGEKDYFKIIRTMYEHLNDVPEIQPILKSIAFSEHLNIIFDFKNSSVQEMDPTKKEGVRGTTYNMLGFIYLAVKNYQSKFYELIGTLAHEMTHYSMQLVYENNCKPYRAHDSESQRCFELVLRESREIDAKDKSKSDDIISRVFSCYKIGKWQAELIVRVPQLLIHYKNDQKKCQMIRSNFPKLFSYYSERVVGDMKDFAVISERKSLIRRINQSGALLALIREKNDCFKGVSTLELCQQNDELNVFSSDVRIMTLEMIYRSFENNNDGDCNNIYLSIESIINNNELKQKTKEAFDSIIKPLVIIDCVDKLKPNLTNFGEFIAQFEDKNRIVAVISRKEKYFLKRNTFVKHKIQSLVHSWKEVEENYRQELMEQQISLQSNLVKLNQILESNSDAMNEFSLNDFFKADEAKFNENKHTELPFIISRKFAYKGGSKKKFKIVEKSIDDLIAFGIRERIVLISDKVGSGKSCALNEIRKVLEEKNHFRWISLFDLKQHVDAYKEVSSDENVSFENFLLSTVLKHKKSFEQKLFSHLFQKGEVIILLDGFDEISPTYNEIWTKALKSFNRNSNNQVWIATRSHLEEDLKKALNCSTSFSLVPLSNSEQIEYLTSFLVPRTENEEVTDEVFKETNQTAKYLISKFDSLSFYKQSSLGAPLILSMLAEICKNKNKTSNFSLDSNMYSLFNQFICCLIENWKKKGELAENDDKEIFKNESNIWKIHEKLALKYLYEKDVQKLGINVEYDEDEWTRNKLSRIGIFLSKNKVGNFQHETFAEFFVARYVFTNLNSTGKKLIGAVKLLVEILQREESKIVRFFLNEAISQKEPKVFGLLDKFKSLSEIMLKQIEETESYQLLVNIAFEPSDQIISLIANVAKHSSKQLINQMLNAEIEIEYEYQKQNALQIAANCNSKHFIVKISEIVDLSDNKAIFTSLTPRNENLFHLSARNKENQGVFTFILQYIAKYLSDEEVKKLLLECDSSQRNILHQVSCVNSAKEIFEALTERLSKDDLRKMLLEKDRLGNNCLHSATKYRSKDVIEEFCAEIEKHFEGKEKAEFYKSCGFKNKNLLHFSADNKENDEAFTTLLNFMQKSLSKKEINCLLCDKNELPENILHLISVIGTSGSAKKIISVIKERLSKKQIIKLLMEKDFFGETCLHKAVDSSDKVKVEEIFKLIDCSLETEEKQELIESTDSEERNILLLAASNESCEDAFEIVFNHVSNFLSAEKVKIMLQQTDSKQNNIFHLVCSHNYYQNNIKLIFQTLTNNLSTEEFNKMLLNKNSDGYNCLNAAIMFNNKSVIEDICDQLEKYVELEKRKEIFKSLTRDGRNNFHLIAGNRNEKVFKSFLKCAKKYLSDEEVKSLLKQSDKDQRNIFHFLAISESDKKSKKEIFEMLLKFLDKEDVLKLIFDKDVEGNNCLHRAIAQSNKTLVEDFFDLLQVYLGDKDMKDLLKSSGKKGRNILHLALERGNYRNEVFSTVFKWIAKTLNGDEVKALLLQKDEDQSNILHLVAKCRREDSMNKICTILTESLEKEEMKEFLIGKNSEGLNCLQIATACNYSATVETICSLLDSFLEENVRKDFLKCQGLHGRNLLLSAASNESGEEVFTTILECMARTLDDKEIKSLMLQKDSNQSNILHLTAKSIQFDQYSMKSYRICKILTESLGKEEMSEILIGKNSEGLNCLQIATACNNSAIVEAICSLLDAFLEENMRKDFLKCQGLHERNLLLLTAAGNENSGGVFTTILECMAHTLDDKEIKSLMLQKDSSHSNIFHLVAANRKISKKANEIFTILAERLMEEEFIELLIDKNVDGNNCLHLAIKHNESKVFEVIFNFVDRIRDGRKKEDFFTSLGSDEKNIFHFAASNQTDGKTFTTVFKCARKILKDEHIKKLLQQKDSNESNILHFAADFYNKKSMNEIFTILNENLSKEQLKKLLFDKNSEGNNCLHHALRFNSEDMIEEFCRLLDLFLEDSDRKELFTSLGFEERNIFHFAACNQNDESVLPTFLSYVDKTLNKEEINILIEKNDSKKFNILHLSAIFSSEESIEETFTTLKKRLNKESLVKLLFAEDFLGNNCLHLAIANNDKVLIIKFCELIRSFLGDVEFKKLLSSCGQFGMNIFHFAASNRDFEGILTTFLKIASKYFDDEEIKKMLLKNDQLQNNILHVRFSNKRSREEVLEVLNERLSKDELEKLIEENEKALEKYKEESARLESFNSNSFPKIDKPSIEELAASGFYYLGQASEVNDLVCCFNCGLEYYDWEITGNPMKIHEEHSSDCSFLQLSRGKLFA